MPLPGSKGLGKNGWLNAAPGIAAWEQDAFCQPVGKQPSAGSGSSPI